MAQSPPLEALRVWLQPFTRDYVSERYVSWLNTPEVMRYSEQRFHHHTLASCREYAESFTGTPNYFWAIVAKDQSLGHIGNMNAYVDERHQVADIGILLGERSVWGRGYATEAWLAACDFLLRNLGLRKVTAGTLSINTPMLRLMERVGMSPDGRRPRQYLWDDQEVDIVHAALFRTDWLVRYPGGPFATT
jgi:RimJ/RimL family protein N-acetyltransferase